MGEHHTSAIERILHRIEGHLEDWRRRDAALQAAADESRSRLWAEAAERERLLAEAVGAEEARRESIEELTMQHRVIFVLHRDEVVETLEDFARQGGRDDQRRPQGLVAGLRILRMRAGQQISKS